MLNLVGASDQLTDTLRQRLKNPKDALLIDEAKSLRRKVGILVHRGSLAVPGAQVQDLLQEIQWLSRRLRRTQK